MQTGMFQQTAGTRPDTKGHFSASTSAIATEKSNKLLNINWHKTTSLWENTEPSTKECLQTCRNLQLTSCSPQTELILLLQSRPAGICSTLRRCRTNRGPRCSHRSIKGPIMVVSFSSPPLGGTEKNLSRTDPDGPGWFFQSLCRNSEGFFQSIYEVIAGSFQDLLRA